MDEDLEGMSREQLAMEGCVKYRKSLDEQARSAPRSREPFEQ